MHWTRDCRHRCGALVETRAGALGAGFGKAPFGARHCFGSMPLMALSLFGSGGLMWTFFSVSLRSS